MQVRVKKNAPEIYIETHTNFRGTYTGKDKWEMFFEKIKGKTLEVDTESLFKYEYNIKPIKGISKGFIRLTEDYVEEVIDDIRYGKARCDLCGETSNSVEKCTNCGNSDYLEPFFEEYDDFYKEGEEEED